jgi:hypothetical protein
LRHAGQQAAAIERAVEADADEARREFGGITQQPPGMQRRSVDICE